MSKSLSVLIMCGSLLIAGCNTGPTAEEIAMQDERDRLANAAAAQAEAERQCVHAAMTTIFSDPRDDDSVMQRMGVAELTLCPGDFSSAFVSFRSAFGQLVETGQRLRSHKAMEGDAVGKAAVTEVAEWLTGTDSGITPYRDWEGTDATLNAQLSQFTDALRTARNQLETVAATYGATLRTAMPDADNGVSAVTDNGADTMMENAM